MPRPITFLSDYGLEDEFVGVVHAVIAHECPTARVIDLSSAKPIDTTPVIQAALEPGHIIVAEDHWAQGGLGDAVLETLADADNDALIRRLAVHTMPTSGRPEELLWRSGIDRTWIATAARDLLEQAPARTGHHRARAHAWRQAR